MQFTKPKSPHIIKRPLISHPELEIITARLTADSKAKADHAEYRVYNYTTYGKGKVDRGNGWGLGDLLVISALAWIAWTQDLLRLFNAVCDFRTMIWDRQSLMLFIWVASLFIYIKYKCSTVLYESIVPLPALGLQLYTTRGLSFPWFSKPHKRLLFPLSTSYTFTPLSEISTVILNQALTRFSVKYYIGIVKTDGKGVVVGFNNVRPRFEVLKEVYHGVREILFDEFNDVGQQCRTNV